MEGLKTPGQAVRVDELQAPLPVGPPTTMAPRPGSADGSHGMVDDDRLRQRIQRLVAQHFDFAARSLRNFGVRAADVDDAVQQVFIVIWHKLDRVEPQAERAFLFQTALRIASRHRRTHARRREASEELLEGLSSGVPLADDVLDGQRARALLDRVLDRMPDDLRAVLVLYEVEQLGTGEIAKLLRLPRGTVKSRLRRAREEFSRLAQAVRRQVGAGAPPRRGNADRKP